MVFSDLLAAIAPPTPQPAGELQHEQQGAPPQGGCRPCCQVDSIPVSQCPAERPSVLRLDAGDNGLLRRALKRGENGRTNGVASERTSCASLRPPLHTRVLADDRPLTRRDNDSRDDCRHGSSKLCITRTMLHMFGRRPAWADNRASSLACSRAANGVLKRIHALGRLIGDCQRVFSAAGEQRPEVLAGPPIQELPFHGGRRQSRPPGCSGAASCPAPG